MADLLTEAQTMRLLADLMEISRMIRPQGFFGSYLAGEDLGSLFAQFFTGRLRVLYFTFPVTVPAHSETEISIVQHREAHMDYTGEHKDRHGYDLTTTLDSTLRFTEQRAGISGWEWVEILDQNFGFDPKQGVTEVVLDPAVEYYWMDLRKR